MRFWSLGFRFQHVAQISVIFYILTSPGFLIFGPGCLHGRPRAGGDVVGGIRWLGDRGHGEGLVAGAGAGYFDPRLRAARDGRQPCLYKLQVRTFPNLYIFSNS